jgi:hypothetical protein
VPPPDPTPGPALAALRRRFAGAAFGLLVGIALNVLGETGLGPWVFVGSLALAIWTAHQIGRSGVDRPLAPPQRTRPPSP